MYFFLPGSPANYCKTVWNVLKIFHNIFKFLESRMKNAWTKSISSMDVRHFSHKYEGILKIPIPVPPKYNQLKVLL